MSRKAENNTLHSNVNKLIHNNATANLFKRVCSNEIPDAEALLE